MVVVVWWWGVVVLWRRRRRLGGAAAHGGGGGARWCACGVYKVAFDAWCVVLRSCWCSRCPVSAEARLHSSLSGSVISQSPPYLVVRRRFPCILSLPPLSFFRCFFWFFIGLYRMFACIRRRALGGSSVRSRWRVKCSSADWCLLRWFCCCLPCVLWSPLRGSKKAF